MCCTQWAKKSDWMATCNLTYIALRRVQFDARMLDGVQDRGITAIPNRTSDMEIHSDQAVVYTENESLTGDVSCPLGSARLGGARHCSGFNPAESPL